MSHIQAVCVIYGSIDSISLTELNANTMLSEWVDPLGRLQT